MKMLTCIVSQKYPNIVLPSVQISSRHLSVFPKLFNRIEYPWKHIGREDGGGGGGAGETEKCMERRREKRESLGVEC